MTNSSWIMAGQHFSANDCGGFKELPNKSLLSLMTFWKALWRNVEKGESGSAGVWFRFLQRFLNPAP